MNVEIKHSHIQGKGVFAKESMTEGSWSYVYGWLKEYVPGDITDRYGFEWDDDHMIYIPFAPWSFLNHSDTPNCQIEKDIEKMDVIIIVTKPVIYRGSELTIDYGFNPKEFYT